MLARALRLIIEAINKAVYERIEKANGESTGGDHTWTCALTDERSITHGALIIYIRLKLSNKAPGFTLDFYCRLYCKCAHICVCSWVVDICWRGGMSYYIERRKCMFENVCEVIFVRK